MNSSLSTPPSAVEERSQLLAAGFGPQASGVLFPELTSSVLESNLDSVHELKKQYSNLIIQIDRLRLALTRIDPLKRLNDFQWTISEVFGHLIDSDRDVWWPRIDQMLVEDHPTFVEVNAEALVRKHHWDTLPLEDVLGQLLRVRWNNSMRLNSLPRSAFDRSGIHPEYGEMTLAQVLAVLVANDAHYLGLVRTITESPEEGN